MREQGTNGAEPASPPLFRESQHFRMWMFWVPILVVTGLVWYEFYQQIVSNNPSGTQPIPDWAAWVLTVVFGLGFPALGLTLRLITELRPGGLKMRVFPFRAALIPLKDVVEAEVRQYSGQREYGGWGVRTGRSGKAYTAYGNQGVQLWLKGDERILIGTQRPAEFLAALRQAGVFVR
jgi:hypothetical protein